MMVQFAILVVLLTSCVSEMRTETPTEEQNVSQFEINKKGNTSYINGFRTPMGLNIDRFGNLYVSQFRSENDHALHKFDSDYNYLGQLAFNKNGEHGWTKHPVRTMLSKPHAIDFDAQNNLYVTDYGAKKILKYSSNGQLLGSFTTKLIGPATAYFGKNDELYISDYGSDAIVVSNTNLKYLRTIKNSFDRVHCVAFDNNNNMYVADCWNHRVMKYNDKEEYLGWIGMDNEGKQHNSWQKQGIAIASDIKGGQHNPIALTVVNETLYVLEWGNGRIQKFSLNGKRVGEISLGLSKPYDFKIYNNKIFVTDTKRNRIIIAPLS